MALSDYQLIEYIEGNGSAYLNLGSDERPNRNWSIYAIATINPTETQYIWGVNDGSYYYDFAYGGSTNAYIWRNASSTNRLIAQNTLFPVTQKISIDQFRSSSTSNPTTCTVADYPDENTSYSENRSYPSAANATKNLYLMARNNNGSVVYQAQQGTRLYLFEVHNYVVPGSNDMRYKMVPVREKTVTDPKVGMYDIVSDRVLWSPVSNFVAGPDVRNASQLWIRQSGNWNSGTPYIRQSGTWTAGTPYIKQSGSWNQGS